MFTREIIDGMDKSQVKAAKGLGSILNDDDKTMLDARLAVLTAPPAPTPFPKQAELTDAYAQWKSWGATIKTLVSEARTGNHTFTNGDGETVKAAKTRKAPVTTEAKPVMIVDGREYTAWRSIADEYKVRPHLPRDGQNWRKPVMLDVPGGIVRIAGMTVEEYSKYFPIPKDSTWTYIAAEDAKTE